MEELRGHPVLCDGPGEVWEMDDKGEYFYCKYTYRTVKDQPFTLTSTVRFRVDVTTNAPEVFAPPPVEKTTEREINVREIQVVEAEPE